MSIEQPPRDLEISTFANVWDVAPKRTRCTVGGLVRALTTFPVFQVPDKRSLPAWSPATFAPGAPRRADTVLAVGCLVLDVDEGDPEAAFEAWPGLLAVTHTTWSHSSERPRYRLVLPLARPVPARLWGQAWAWASSRAVEADPACKDPSRLYFRPAVASTDAPHSARFQGGALLDLVGLLPDEPPPRHPPAASGAIVRVPARLRDRGVAISLGQDPEFRERTAAELGARLLGTGPDRRATHAGCPSCGRASVWFYVEPRRLRWARCNHRGTCGWEGPLGELLQRRAA
ncbi:MAG: hypothetical protein H6736_21145 [Alphaproteobacteria bacterium]|nr:hypothetical protein [Myxococcales bacterium]MCB9694324.1 hypothetical protein [Alphaproteobacteria bacterium]